MSSGAKVVSAYAKQTDKDVLPQTGWKILPNVSNGLSVSTELTNSETITDTRIQKSGMVTGGTVEGDIEVEFMATVYDDLLAGAFFGEWVESGANKKLEIGNTKSMFAISKDFTDINVNHVFTGCVTNTFKLDITTDALVKATFGFMGLGYQNDTATSFAKTPEKAIDGKKASGLSIGTILVDNVDIGVCVESISFELDNQAEVQKCLGDNIYGGNILAMLANASGSMTVAYSQKAHNIVKEQLTGKTFAVEVPIEFSDESKYILKLPKVQVSGEVPSPSGTDLVTINISYTVVDESPIIEKVGA